MDKKNKLLILSTALVAIIIALISTSYAFFTGNVTGNDEATPTVITSGNLAVTFSDGLEVSKSDMIPGESITKTFSVENTGTGELKYDIYFSEICNLFVNNNDLVYTLTSTNNGYSVLTPISVPTTPSKLINSQKIEAGVTQDYELTITFVNADYDQSNEMGAYFATKLNINDYKNAEHCSKYNNTVKYYVNNVEVQDMPSNVGYLYSTSNCTNDANITWDNINWNYAVDYDSSTADSVCSINFIPEEYTITYNLDGGTNNSSNPSSYTIESDTITLSNPTKEGYTFNGWIGDNATIAKGSTGNKTYTATWTASTYTLTLNPNNGTYNGTTATSTKTMTYGTTNNNSIGVATRSGYTFDGWYTALSGGTQVYNSSGNNVNASTYWTAAYSTGTWKYTGSLTLYAHWTSSCNDGISSVNGTKNFSYTGSVQTFNACAGRKYKLEVWGAQGGNSNTHSGATSYTYGYGGYAYGEILISNTQTLYVIVGQSGDIVSNGLASQKYNGGGATKSNCSNSNCSNSSGGGASHISNYNCGELKNCSSYKSNILIVAGGGGGGGNQSQGGHGGGYIGMTPPTTMTYSNRKAGGGGNQTTCGYTHTSYTTDSCGFGKGSSSVGKTNLLGGGGGGWYGGGTGDNSTGGGGGSGYIGNSLLTNKGMYMYTTGCTSSTATATKTTCTSNTGAHVSNYANTGNGYARITRLS